MPARLRRTGTSVCEAASPHAKTRFWIFFCYPIPAVQLCHVILASPRNRIGRSTTHCIALPVVLAADCGHVRATRSIDLGLSNAHCPRERKAEGTVPVAPLRIWPIFFSLLVKLLSRQQPCGHHTAAPWVAGGGGGGGGDYLLRTHLTLNIKGGNKPLPSEINWTHL